MSDRPTSSVHANGVPRKLSESGRLILAPEVPPPKHDPLAKPMFWIAAAHLLLFAGLIHRFPQASAPDWEKVMIAAGTLTLWAVIVLEAVYRLIFLAAGSRPKEGVRTLLIALFPPARMGAPSLIRRGQIYLPGMRWRDMDERLEEKLARKLRLPMILFALLILPLLALELWKIYTVKGTWLEVVLDVGSSVIWIAFAVDFVLGIAVATKPVRYFFKHLLDFMIVVIPMFQFLLSQYANAALLARLGRLSQLLGRSARLYQLRTLPLKAWQALVALELVQKLAHRALLWLMGIDPLLRRRDKINQELTDIDRQRTRLFEERIDIDKKIAAREAVKREEAAT